MRKTKFKLIYINGLKQEPIDLDFHITPVLTFSRSDKRVVGDLGNAWGFALEWGHWAFGFGFYTVIKTN